MSLSLLRIGTLMPLALAATVAFAEAAPADPKAQPPQSSAVVDSNEGFSTDDIKDVFEAFHFVMYSIGVGAALYWFWCYYLPSQEHPRLEFEVDVQHVGENDGTWILEIVALVKNLGRKQADLSELRFSLESVVADRVSGQGGSLANLKALQPLFEGAWVPAAFVLDAGTQSRRAVAVAVPKTVTQVVVTAQMRNGKRTDGYFASRTVRLPGVLPGVNE